MHADRIDKSAHSAVGGIRRESLRTLADYREASRAVAQALEAGSWSPVRTLRVAIVGAGTLNGLDDCLKVECALLDVRAEIYLGGYEQIEKLLLAGDSELYGFAPDVVLLAWDLQWFLGNRRLRPYGDQEPRLPQFAEQRGHELHGILDAVLAGSKAAVIAQSFAGPLHSPLGILEGRAEGGLWEVIDAVNAGMIKRARSEPRLWIARYDRLSSQIGHDGLVDWNMYYLGDIRIAPKWIPRLAQMYMRYLRPMLGRMHKCLVLDLDGTLWGGIIGEDGIHGIALGPEADGRPYYELQQWLLALYERGIVLAINSRNNFADAMDVIRNHPHCLLRERHFAAVRINWQDKASNLVEIAQELNIGLDSLVFLDDDPVNRALVRQAAPAVYVVDLPKNPACFLPAVQQLDVFDTLQLTREDLRKSQQYSEQAQRSRCREASGSLDEYLAALQTVLTVKAVGPETLARAAQLTQKTNQFNVTTRRYLEADLLEQQAKGWRLYIGAVKDRFGDSGWTALAIVEPAEDTWRIDTFLLSCRIIGRGVEEAMLSCICRDAAEAGASCITGEFVASPKNQIAASFYASAGFQPIESAGELRRWLRPVSPAVKAPLYITLSGR